MAHSPSPVRKALADLSTRLIDLHKDFLSFETQKVEKEDGRRYGPYEVLNLTLHDKRFDWLRHLSKLISEIDTLTAEEEQPEIKEVHTLLERAEKIFGDKYEDFALQCRQVLEAQPYLVAKKAAVTKSLSELRALTKTL